jgi:hypothetical protein
MKSWKTNRSNSANTNLLMKMSMSHFNIIGCFEYGKENINPDRKISFASRKLYAGIIGVFK